MPMIRCSRCGKQISTRAGSCCRCGAPIADRDALEAYDRMSARRERRKDVLSISALLLTVGMIIVIAAIK